MGGAAIDTPGIHLVGGGVLGPGITDDWDCNYYVARGRERAVLVDCGAGRTDIAVPPDVDAVLLTHLHLDHAGGAAALARRGLRIFAHPWTAEGLRAGDEERAGLAYARAEGFYPADARLEACEVDDLDASAELDLGGLVLTALATPGHSGGHYAFLAEDETGRRTLLGGDLVFAGGAVVLQPLPDCDADALRESLERARSAAPDALAAGHGPVVTSAAVEHIEIALAAFAAGGLPRQLGA
jgi:glyoxylase-like metal-dependent hydrolase (beta-lactamase superfamily II)